MKNLIITLLATAAHIVLFILAYQYLQTSDVIPAEFGDGAAQGSLLVIFWSALTATWVAGILAEALSNR
jgi:hypothetical protein